MLVEIDKEYTVARAPAGTQMTITSDYVPCIEPGIIHMTLLPGTLDPGDGVYVKTQMNFDDSTTVMPVLAYEYNNFEITIIGDMINCEFAGDGWSIYLIASNDSDFDYVIRYSVTVTTP